MLQSTSARCGRCESATAWQRLGPGSAAAAAEGTAAEGTAAAARSRVRACPPAAEAKRAKLHLRRSEAGGVGRGAWRVGRGAWRGRRAGRASGAHLSSGRQPSAPAHRLNDSTRYFFERAADILSPAYLPTEQDSLRARVRTTGIVQQHFEIHERKYTMFDVGGQRNERRKVSPSPSPNPNPHPYPHPHPHP